jgi:hypothetical protein
MTIYEGGGKSTFAIKICDLASSEEFSVDNVIYGYKEFCDFLDTKPPNQAIDIDESGDFLMSREAMGKERRDFLKRMMKVRSSNHFLVFVISDITLLERYIKSFRASCLCRIVNKYDIATGDVIRGIVEVYGKKRMKNLPKDSASGAILWHKVRPLIVERYEPVRGELWEKYLEKKAQYLSEQKITKQRKTIWNDIEEQYGKKDYKRNVLVKMICTIKSCKPNNAYRIIHDSTEKGYVSEDRRGNIHIT